RRAWRNIRSRRKAYRAILANSLSVAISLLETIAQLRALQRPTRRARRRPLAGIDDVSYRFPSLTSVRRPAIFTAEGPQARTLRRPTTRCYATAAKANAPIGMRFRLNSSPQAGSALPFRQVLATLPAPAAQIADVL